MVAPQTQERTGRVVYLMEHPPMEPPQMFADLPDIVTTKQAADKLGVDPKTIRREIERGHLKCFHVGTRVRITKQALIEYILEGENAE